MLCPPNVGRCESVGGERALLILYVVVVVSVMGDVDSGDAVIEFDPEPVLSAIAFDMTACVCVVVAMGSSNGCSERW